MAFDKVAAALAAGLTVLALSAPAADLSNDEKASAGRTTDRTTSTDSRPLSDSEFSDAIKTANDTFDEKFKECGEITGSPSLDCRNDARATRDRVLTELRLLRHPNPRGGEGK